MKLGSYPALPLAEARRRALGIAARVANGADPAKEKKVERKAAARAPDVVRTVRTIADEFLKRHTDEKNGARWAAETNESWTATYCPQSATSPPRASARPRFTTYSTPFRRGTPIAANRTLAVVKKLYRWALSRGYVDRDPCAGIAKPGDETKRDRVLSDDELAASGARRKVWPIRSGRPSGC